MSEENNRSLRLKDRVAIITGGAYGIGRAFCLGLAREGARIVVADIDSNEAEATAEEVAATGGEAMALKTDVASLEDTLEMAEKTAGRFGRIDILINNAAMAGRARIHGVPFHEIDMAVWDRVIAVNLTGAFLCIRAVFPYMKEQGSGKIINISSSTFFSGASSLAHYVASKGGIIGLTRSLSVELGQYNINVNSIAPGSTLSSGIGDRETLAMSEKIAQGRSLKRVEYPEDLVGAAVFFASSDSDFITGQTLLIDGGDYKH